MQATQTAAADKPTIDSDGLPAGERLSLEELTRIMDVATTLRKERAIVEQQLNIGQIKAKLRERLLEAAKVSGDPVTAAEVDAAVEQYYDRLHEFQEPPAGFAKFLAHAWVWRARIVKVILVGAALVGGLLLWGAFSAVREALRAEDRWQSVFQDWKAIVAFDEAASLKAELQSLVDQAAEARTERDFDKLDRIKAEVAKLRNEFESQYVINILSSPDEISVRERIWNDEQGSRTSGFFAIVTARDDEGHDVPVTIHDRETDATKTVTRWGEQVPEAVFDRLAADKQADGVLDEREFAVKHRGTRELEIVLKGEDGRPIPRGGQITSW